MTDCAEKSKVELLEQTKQKIMIDNINPATPRQTFALYVALKTDVRGLNLTMGQASGFISRAESDPIAVKQELLALGAIDKGAVAKAKQDYAAIYAEAHRAGMAAGQACNPTPMIVQQHANMANDNSPVVKSYFVEGGVCGFASIIINPGTCGFARWAKKEKLADKHYYGGMAIWVGEFGQSMQRKEAYASAFAAVLNKHGIKSYATSRMD